MRGTISVPFQYGSASLLQCAAPHQYRSGPLFKGLLPTASQGPKQRACCSRGSVLVIVVVVVARVAVVVEVVSAVVVVVVVVGGSGGCGYGCCAVTVVVGMEE